ncbi:MAG: hypothetical protein GC164_15635 [Phycisphaera sp.]|nr:hypothetical protein [Phycisphaera sp.]
MIERTRDTLTRKVRATPDKVFDDARHADRVLIVGKALVALCTMALVGLIVRVVMLQADPPQSIAQLLDTQRTRLVLRPRRGALLDRQGRIIATTHTAESLFVDPAIIADPNTFSERVGYSLGYDPAKVEQMLARRPNSRFVVIDKRLDDEREDLFEKLPPLSGLSTQTRLVRDYPFGNLAGQIVGFVGVDGQGLDGLERLFDKQLTGTPGSIVYFRDAKHRPLWVDQSSYTPPEDATPLRLSLDMTVQLIAETELAAACHEFDAKAGQVIVMDPTTGEILAMANYPDFDPNAKRQATPDEIALRRNRCVTDVFEPGSIFKPFVWSMATQLGAANPSETIDCTTSGVWVTPAKRVLHDAHPAGTTTWAGVLIHSSNIGMAKVALRLKEQQLHDALTAFGFGESTRSGLPGEVDGIVTPMKKWTHYSTTSTPMGQEIAVTPMQITRAFCALANGGNLVHPTILAANQPGKNSPGSVVVYERVLTPEAAQTTRSVLRRVVTEGTGRKANSDLYAIFGKTGTAQIADRKKGGYLPGAFVGSFVCGAPLDRPRIVVGCFIHQPGEGKNHYGGTIAAPAAKRIVEQTLIYLGVTPQPPRDTISPSQLVRANGD